MSTNLKPVDRDAERQTLADNDSQKGDPTLIAALAAGASIREAAEAAGVGERTVYRRLQDPDFKRRVTQARSAFISGAVGKLAEASIEAVATMRELLSAKSESVRLSAARAILEIGPKLREHTELEERIAALEEATADEGKGQKS
jgi:HEAT repeat protein